MATTGKPRRASRPLRRKNPRRDVFSEAPACAEPTTPKGRNCIELVPSCTKTRHRLECFRRDPIGFAGGDLNLYRYVGNRPIVAIDPSGFTEFRDCLKRSTYYCAASKEHPENSWLSCACNVSYLICLGANAHAIAPLTNSAQKARWLFCMNKCMFAKWLSGYQDAYPSSPLPDTSGLLLEPPTDEWKRVSFCLKNELCDGSKLGRRCCRTQVYAEQSGLQQCMAECGPYNPGWGKPFEFLLWPELGEYIRQLEAIGVELPPFDGDFNSLKDRLKYGYLACDCGPLLPTD